MKRLLILVFVLIFVSVVYAQCPITPGRHGVEVEGICYDCGEVDGVCPEDFGVDCIVCDEDCEVCEEPPEEPPEEEEEPAECDIIEFCEDYDVDTCTLDPCSIGSGTVDDYDIGDSVCYVMCTDEDDGVCLEAECVTCPYVCEACGEIGCAIDEAECDSIIAICESDENCNDCDNLELCEDEAFIEYCNSLKEPEEDVIDYEPYEEEPFPIFTLFNLILTSFILVGFYVFIHKKR